MPPQKLTLETHNFTLYFKTLLYYPDIFSEVLKLSPKSCETGFKIGLFPDIGVFFDP